jgi:putative transposase
MQPSDMNLRRLHLVDRLIHLPEAHLGELERFLDSFEPGARQPESSSSTKQFDWPHAPVHRISKDGTFIVTAATLDHAHLFKGTDRLDYLLGELLSQLRDAGWELEAWAVFSNHYHFVAHALPGAELLSSVLRELHRSTSLHVNKLDLAHERQTWYQFWETRLSYEESYLARLSYVHQNAVKHGLVEVANQYRWCSAEWFERMGTPAQVKTVYRMKIDRVKVEDDFQPV